MTALTEIQPPSPSNAYSAAMSALMLELAKMLKLVAPISMSADAQMVWLQAAADALDGIHAHEVAAVSMEVRRSITRPSQIVPMIADLVAKRRQRPPSCASETVAEYKIDAEAQKRRAKARSREEVQAAADWERQARIDNGYAVQPLAEPLSRDELKNLTPQMLRLGLNSGFLTYRAGQLVEVQQ